MFEYWQLIAAWGIYFTIHSLWASSVFKNWMSHFLPASKSWYRIVYNLFAILLLIPVLWIQRNQEQNILYYHPSIYLSILGYTGVVIGLLVGNAGFKNYSLNEFSGGYQLKNHHEFHPSNLNIDGLNGVVRHPLYLAGLIAIWSYFLASPTSSLLITNLCISSYLYLGTLFEEKKLILEFGNKYAEYKKEVSMLVPVKWVLKKLKN